MANRSQAGLTDIERAAIQILVERELTAAVRDLNLENPFIPLTNGKTTMPMTITGASYLGETLKAKVQAAKDRIVASQAKHDDALTKINSAADAADCVSSAIEAEADNLMAQIGQFSNGSTEK